VSSWKTFNSEKRGVPELAVFAGGIKRLPRMARRAKQRAISASRAWSGMTFPRIVIPLYLFV
jgi:hypothetical protein